MPVCSDNVHWGVCAQQVVTAIDAAPTPAEAFALAELWAARYQRLYEANAQNHWTVAENRQFEEAVKEEISSQIDQWTKPEQIALDLAIARYFPRLAAAIGFATGAVASGLLTFITPAPLANDFIAAGPSNREVNDALKRKIAPLLHPIWEQSYSQSIQNSFQKVKQQPILH